MLSDQYWPQLCLFQQLGNYVRLYPAVKRYAPISYLAFGKDWNDTKQSSWRISGISVRPQKRQGCLLVCDQYDGLYIICIWHEHLKLFGRNKSIQFMQNMCRAVLEWDVEGARGLCGLKKGCQPCCLEPTDWIVYNTCTRNARFKKKYFPINTHLGSLLIISTGKSLI